MRQCFLLRVALLSAAAVTHALGCVVGDLNEAFIGYQEGNESSPVGVTMRFLPHDDNYTMYFCGQGCYNGQADCRVSASLLNHKIMVNATTGRVAATMGRKVAVVFNQSMVEKDFGKCSYVFDGASDYRYNMGCGCIAPLTKPPCAPQSAFGNTDPKTGKPFNSSSPALANCDCENGQIHPVKPSDPPCFWKGSAFYQNNGTNKLRKMMENRMQSQAANESYNDVWNEVVIDGVRLLQSLRTNPGAAIAAIAWMKTGDPSGDAIAKEYAAAAEARWRKEYSFPAPVPIVALDLLIDVRKGVGPFVDGKTPSPVTFV